MKKNRKEVDFLVIGSGIAGLTFALKVAAYGRVAIITKTFAEESNTKYAQGGIAAVTQYDDSISRHIADTLEAGAGLCKRKIVELTIREGIERVKEIITWGTRFDKTSEGLYDLAKEGGHSKARILHYKDMTGNEIERALLSEIKRHKNISMFTHYFALDLLTQHHLGVEVSRRTKGIECYGCYALNLKSKYIETILARKTLIATGGIGHIYKNSTNPVIATGDGIAMAYRAKAKVTGMEFIQFHPTALYEPGAHPSFLISEAVRGSGGILKDADGKEFMHQYDKRKSLAPRDIVARAIDNEMKKSGSEFVYLDCRKINPISFRKHFPNILEKCKTLNLNPVKNLVPVVPAAHYICGGITTDEWGKTSIHNLYAAGECANTGLHGANRLASNSLLEALVFSHRASVSAVKTLKSSRFRNAIPDWDAKGTSNPKEKVLITQNKKELQEVMSNHVGIVRSNIRLKRALNRLRILYGETEALYERTTVSPSLCELRNMISIGYLVVTQAMLRKKNIGLHFNIDQADRVSN